MEKHRREHSVDEPKRPYVADDGPALALRLGCPVCTSTLHVEDPADGIHEASIVCRGCGTEWDSEGVRLLGKGS